MTLLKSKSRVCDIREPVTRLSVNYNVNDPVTVARNVLQLASPIVLLDVIFLPLYPFLLAVHIHKSFIYTLQTKLMFVVYGK